MQIWCYDETVGLDPTLEEETNNNNGDVEEWVTSLGLKYYPDSIWFFADLTPYDDGECFVEGPPEATSRCVLHEGHEETEHKDDVGGTWPVSWPAYGVRFAIR